MTRFSLLGATFVFVAAVSSYGCSESDGGGNGNGGGGGTAGTAATGGGGGMGGAAGGGGGGRGGTAGSPSLIGIARVTYLKASNTGENDSFGQSVGVSGNGNTLAIGADFEGSGADGVNGDQADDSEYAAGAVYIYRETGTTWAQEAYVKASNSDGFDRFGLSVSLSADGDTMVVGADREASGATGIDGDESDNSAGAAGAAYVFQRNGATWSQRAYIKGSNANADDRFGVAVSLSADGNTLAVGALQEASSATGINGDESDNSAPEAGAVYVFQRDGTRWSQEAYIKASNTDAGDRFGGAVSVSGDGGTLAVGADLEASSATGINGDESDNSAPEAGAVYVFQRDGTRWNQAAYIKASNTGSGDGFGIAVSLNGDGDTLAVGSYLEDSGSTEFDDGQPDAGAVYVFRRSGGTWNQEAYVKASNVGPHDYFGVSVSLSTAGNAMAVGAYGEDGAVDTFGSIELDDTAPDSGAAYLFAISQGTWTEEAYLASNSNPFDAFGIAVRLNGDATSLIVGALGEDSDAVGVDGERGGLATGSGAAYLYELAR